MKTIMIPIQPKWAELEMNSKKTIEVRKFYIEPPFKVVNYVTQENRKTYFNLVNHYGQIMFAPKSWDNALNGKVAYEYVVNKVDMYLIYKDLYNEMYLATIGELEQACLTQKEIREYGKGKDIYGWHISDLKIYDEPLELGEFRKPCKNTSMSALICNFCEYAKRKWDGKKTFTVCRNIITRPPQSWQYVRRRNEGE